MVLDDEAERFLLFGSGHGHSFAQITRQLLMALLAVPSHMTGTAEVATLEPDMSGVRGRFVREL